ncbi:MAG: hypothetical protein QOJ66_277, partial [Ilumatobacteraceae bacterium]
MNAPEIDRTVLSLDGGQVLPRRSFLQLGVGGLALEAGLARQGNSGESQGGDRRRTEQIVRRLLHAFESRDTAAIWSFFADDGVFEFPFIGL